MSTTAEQLVTHLGPDNSFNLFGRDGVMEQNQRVHLSRGVFLHAFGYAMSEQHFVIYDDNMNAVEICYGDPDDVSESDLERYFGPIHHVDATARPIEKLFGIGFYWDTSEVISDEVIEKSLKRADNLKKLEQEVKERKEKLREETRIRLISEYSYLERNEKNDHNIVGKNIRTELKRNFPGVKFSVRYESFSGGDAFDIRWNDGPTYSQVRGIVDKYRGMHPDAMSMGDYWDYAPSVFNKLFGDVGYVTAQREITEKAIETMRQKYPDLTEENKTTYHFEEDGIHGYATEFFSPSVENILRQAAYQVDFTPPRKEEKPKNEHSEQVAATGSFQVVDYSEKAIAITGDTKPIKDDLKRLGGKFNSKLSCGCGWVFGKKNKETITELDQLLGGIIAAQLPGLMKKE